MSSAQKRKCFLDPCHSKNLNVTNLQLSRMKLKMKLELRALKKITEEVVHEGDSYCVVVPANVYENPLDTLPVSTHEGIKGCYGTASEEQLKSFFGDHLPLSSATSAKVNATHVEEEATLEEEEPELRSPSLAAISPDRSLKDVPLSCPVDDIELQNAIWNIAAITPVLALEQPSVPTDQLSFDDFLMDHTGDDNTGVLFDLS